MWPSAGVALPKGLLDAQQQHRHKEQSECAARAPRHYSTVLTEDMQGIPMALARHPKGPLGMLQKRVARLEQKRAQVNFQPEGSEGG